MKKKPNDIQIADHAILIETGFEYVVTWITDKSIKINLGKKEYWIPKSLIEISSSLMSTSGYRLYRFGHLPDWFVEKNSIL